MPILDVPQSLVGIGVEEIRRRQRNEQLITVEINSQEQDRLMIYMISILEKPIRELKISDLKNIHWSELIKNDDFLVKMRKLQHSTKSTKELQNIQGITNLAIFLSQIIRPENSNWLFILYQDLNFDDKKEKNDLLNSDANSDSKIQQYFRINQKNPLIIFTFFLKKFAKINNLEDSTLSQVLDQLQNIYPWFFKNKPFIAKYVDKKNKDVSTAAIAHTRQTDSGLVFVSSGQNFTNLNDLSNKNSTNNLNPIQTINPTFKDYTLTEISTDFLDFFGKITVKALENNKEWAEFQIKGITKIAKMMTFAKQNKITKSIFEQKNKISEEERFFVQSMYSFLDDLIQLNPMALPKIRNLSSQEFEICYASSLKMLTLLGIEDDLLEEIHQLIQNRSNLSKNKIKDYINGRLKYEVDPITDLGANLFNGILGFLKYLYIKDNKAFVNFHHNLFAKKEEKGGIVRFSEKGFGKLI